MNKLLADKRRNCTWRSN